MAVTTPTPPRRDCLTRVTWPLHPPMASWRGYRFKVKSGPKRACCYQRTIYPGPRQAQPSRTPSSSPTAINCAGLHDAGKDIQKRWRSIRDSYTKAYRQGKCVSPEQYTPGSRRLHYHRQMSFLLRALQNKKPRLSQDKYESFSEVSNSPSHPPPEEIPKIKSEIDNPRPETRKTSDKSSQVTIEAEKKLEIKIDANSILPDDHFDDDTMFMNSLIPLFKKMDDDTRLLCRIEVLKIIRYALQGHKCFEALKIAEDSFFKNSISSILTKAEVPEAGKTVRNNEQTKVELPITEEKKESSRPVRKRKPVNDSDFYRDCTPTLQPTPPKRRGPGRPRKIRPPPSDSEDEFRPNRNPKVPKMKAVPVPKLPETVISEVDEMRHVTSVDQLSTNLFMKMYNLGRSKGAPELTRPLPVKTEPKDDV